MASTLSVFSTLLFLTNSIQAFAGVVIEDGYTVSTIVDGNKLSINPHSVLPMFASSDLIILDSVASTFYTFSLSNSQDNIAKRLSGSGVKGYKDGDLVSAMFDNPRSFVVDMKNNVYVADRKNHVIRKISKSGVTTIAGGYTQIAGKVDGPAQNASFSDDFELSLIPQRCALLISDHGNKLVREIKLKSDDCASGSGSVVGTPSAWVFVGLGLACLFGLIVGFAIRPYVLPHETLIARPLNKTWRHYLINLEKRIVIFCFDIRSAIANSKFYQLLKSLIEMSFSQLSLMLGFIIVKPQTTPQKYVSLLDCDDLGSSEMAKTHVLANQLDDLVTSDCSMSSLDNRVMIQADANGGKDDEVVPESHGRIDNLIRANLVSFAEDGKRTSVVESWESSSALAKRR